MSDDVETVETDGGGPSDKVSVGDMDVTSDSETQQDMEENFDAEPPEAPEEEAAAPEAPEEEPAEKVEEKAEEAEAPPPEEEKENPRHSARARVEAATRKLAEERDKNRSLEERLAKLEAQVSPEPEPAAGPPEKPTPEGFETYEAYVEALTDWKTDRKVEALRAETQQQTKAEQQGQVAVDRVDTFNERLNMARAADPELEKKIDPELTDSLLPTSLLPPGVQVGPSNDIAEAIFGSEYCGVLLAHLSGHPEEMTRLEALPDSFAVARAMGSLEERLSQSPAAAPESEPAPEAPPSRAKPPIKPVTSSPQRQEVELTDDTDFDTHVRVMNARDRRTARMR